MRWSARKKRTESLWEPKLDMQIHANAYGSGQWHDYERWWIVLNGEIIWDFPAPFVASNHQPRDGDRLPLVPYHGSRDEQASKILDLYHDRPIAELFLPFENDDWELGDILRAADRRLGKTRLIKWSKDLHPANPARKVLEVRFPRRKNSESQ